MTSTSAVSLYARTAQDRTGEEPGVEGQPEDCRAEAERRGRQVTDEYVDEDITACDGKERPQYERMPTDIAEERRDGVIVWRMDRLHRRRGPRKAPEVARSGRPTTGGPHRFGSREDRVSHHPAQAPGSPEPAPRPCPGSGQKGVTPAATAGSSP